MAQGQQVNSNKRRDEENAQPFVKQTDWDEMGKEESAKSWWID